MPERDETVTGAMTVEIRVSKADMEATGAFRSLTRTPPRTGVLDLFP